MKEMKSVIPAPLPKAHWGLIEWSSAAGIAACAIALISLVFPIHDWWLKTQENKGPQTEHHRPPIQNVVNAASITLSSPAKNQKVGLNNPVSGTSTIGPDYAYYYVLVRGPGGDYIQADQLLLGPQGELTGSATFGRAKVGSGQMFVVCIVATRAPLDLKTQQLPQDTRKSNCAEVERI